MLRRCLSAMVVLVALGGFVLAEEYQGVITKLDDGKLFITVGKKKDDKKKMEIKVAKDVKIALKKGKKSEDLDDKKLGELIAAGHTNKAGKTVKGVRAKIETKGEGDAEEVVSITLTQPKKQPAEDK